MRIKNKIAVVTGAAAGIGQAIARRFAAEGARVICTDVDADAVRSFTEQLVETGFAADWYSMDVTCDEEVSIAIDKISTRFGKIDVLVNNAGRDFEGGIENLNMTAWNNAINLNLTSLFRVTKACWGLMKEQKSSSIINMSSVMGLVGDANSLVYCSAKAAIVMFTNCLAAEGATHGIRVNTVCPGYIETQNMKEFIQSRDDPERALVAIQSKIPFGRMGAPEEIADCCLFLASDDSAYVSGALLTVDGAMTSARSYKAG